MSNTTHQSPSFENNILKRYEFKFLIHRSQLNLLFDFLSSSEEHFYKPFPLRTINNIYYDTLDLDYYYQHQLGNEERSKVRWRWYGTYELFQSPQLEIKIKKYQLGSKMIKKLNKDQMPLNITDILSLNSQEIYRNISFHQDFTPREAFEQTLAHHSLYPTLINSYTRSYWISYDHKIRITLDEAIRYRDPKHQFWTGVADQDFIIEVKFNESEYQKGQSLFRHWPFLRSKNSKYISGMLLLNP